MPDREKVIRWLEACSTGCEYGCPYDSVVRYECKANLMRDALELLKKQEPQVLTLEEVLGGDECWFEHINGACGYADLYVHENGMVGVSRINKIISFIPAESYGKQWRCWSYRPTEEQRKAVKWDGFQNRTE